ncbi:uncharacterized protein LOC126666120 [Mercurialis annua]|uniref:uncharacterized protein LOC126666120 n=1 Tax=Mercurialis annua TaxID=3986 RepID=UPI002160B05E|nr:uncharacterized protein LOC126666120 [Mercurialis annua]
MEKIKEMTNTFHAISTQDWKTVIKFYEKHQDYMMFPLNMNRDTVFHLAMYSNTKQPFLHLQQIFKNYSVFEESDDLFFSRNERGNTILHEAVAVGNLDVIGILVREYPTLIDKKNVLDENPLYTAAAFGQTEIIKFLSEFYGRRNIVKIMSKCERRKIDGKSIIQVAIEGEHFETALLLINLLIEMNQRNRIRRLKDKKGMSALDCLASLPFAFRSGHAMGVFQSFLYSCLPVEDETTNIVLRRGESPIKANDIQFSSTRQMDLENCMISATHRQQYSPDVQALEGIKQSLWKFIQGWQVEKIWKAKRKHKYGLKLARLLIQETIWGDEFGGITNDNQHLFSSDDDEFDEPNPIDNKEEEDEFERNPNLINTQDEVQANPSQNTEHSSDENQGSNFKAIQSQNLSEEDDFERSNTISGEQEPESHTTSSIDPIPLFTATKMGIIEIVREVIEEYPQAVEHLNSKGQNILHLAVLYRRKHIFDMLQMMEIPWMRMTQVIDNLGYTLLHHVADTKHYSGGTRPGPALQLQEELRWFDRVESVVPSYYAMHHENSKNMYTPVQLFEMNHIVQLQQAQKWAKETSQSCSTVAVLVATVVFAAAYTVPGGTNDKGYPHFLDSPYFLAFTVMDVISLACSLTSVVAFLSILTSPFEFDDFRRSIPRKLIFGFTLLFFSVITTMLAFGSTILLVIRKEKQLTASLISVAAFFPVSVFAILQFRLYGTMMKDILSLLMNCLPCCRVLSRPRRRKLY